MQNLLSTLTLGTDLSDKIAGAGTKAFCSGGDQAVRGEGGYVGADKVPRLNVLDLQASHAAALGSQSHSLPKTMRMPWALLPAPLMLEKTAFEAVHI